MNENKQNGTNIDNETVIKPFEVDFGNAAKINLETKPIVDTAPTRQDKSVTVISGDVEKKTSSILLGYNVDSNGNTIIQLSDGSYVSVENFVDAVQESLSKTDAKATVVSKSTGKRLTQEELEKLIEVCAFSGKITLQESRKITNQTAKSVQVLGKDGEAAKNIGSMMLGNDGFQLPNGDYVSLEELQTAIADFQVIQKIEGVSPIPFPTTPTPEEVNKQENTNKRPRKVTKKEKISKKLLPLILIPIMFLGFGKSEKKIISENPQLSVIVKQINDNPENDSFITPEMILDAMNELKIGQVFEAPSGLQVHESSDYEYGGANAIGTIGDKYIPEGTYTINYISVINPETGEIVKVASEPGKSLLETLQAASEQIGVAVEDLEGKLHIDDPTAGWIDVNLDLIREQNITQEKLNSNVLDTGVYYAIDENGAQVHDGKFVTVDGDILTSETHSDLSQASKGDTLYDGENKEYTITDIEAGSEEIVVGTESHNNWSLKNIPKNLETLVSSLQEEVTEVSAYIQNNDNINNMGGNTK